MRVLAVADVVGGVRTFIADLSRELAGRGAEIHLALLGPPEQAVPLRDLPVASIQSRPYALEWMAEPWADVGRAADWIAELAREIRPDVVHMNTFTPVRDRALPVLLTVHSCVLTWWRAVRREEAPPEWRRYRRLAERALDRAQAIVAPSAALLTSLRAVYGALPQARVIPNGSALAEAPIEAEDREPMVLTAGRLWDEAKNIDALSAAGSAIHGRVAVIGEGSAPGVESLGPLPHGDVVAWMRRAAVFAEPARYEPFGLAALEAARSGCALVLGDIPSLREVWHTAAAYVPPDDPDALAAAVNRLLDDPVARKAGAEAALARSRRYSVTAMGEAYRSAMSAVADGAMP